MSIGSYLLRSIQALCFVWTLPLLAQFQLATDHPSALYQVGETAKFRISNANAGTYSYRLYYDTHTNTIESGTFSITANQSLEIPFQASEAGVVFCEVSSPSDTIKTAVAFSPFGINPLESSPLDFDQYWSEQNALVDQLTTNITLTLHNYNKHSTTYSFSLPNIEGRNTYGYITLPNGQGSYPAAIVFPQFGQSPEKVAVEEVIAENAGLITISLSIHNTNVNEEDPNAYQPDQSTDRNTIYYRYALTGAINVINYLYTRSDFDRKNICVMGVGQGGGLAALLAGIDSRVNLLVQSDPALNEHQGHKYKQASGFPYYLSSTNQEAAIYNATSAAIKYYDAVYASQRFKGKSYTVIGLDNEVHPAATSLAGYNQLGGERVLIVSQKDHEEKPETYTKDRFEFLRRHFPSKPSNPEAATTKGYQVEAGNPQTTTANKEISLKAIVHFRQKKLNNLSSQWIKVNGEGTVNFSNAEAASTTATFSQAGTYILRFQAQDDRQLDKEGIIYFLSDDLVVTVKEDGSTNGSLSLNCPNNQVVELESTQQGVVVNWSIPRAVSTCPTNNETTLIQKSGPNSGSLFSVGTTRIKYEAINACSNQATCNFTITVNQSGPIESSNGSATLCEATIVDGMLGVSERQCEPFQAKVIAEITAPTGTASAYEYIWLRSIISCPNTLEQQIEGATQASYDPGLIVETTYFTRWMRPTGCTSWTKGTCIMKAIGPCNTDSETTVPTTSLSSTCLLKPQFISVSGGVTVGGSPTSLIDGTGLSAEAIDGIHEAGNLYSGVWLSDGTTPTFTIDLGSVQTVDGILIWNYAYHYWQVLKRRGVKDFRIATSTDGTAYSAEEAFTATMTTDSGKGEQAQRFAFSAAKSARYIRLKVDNAQNDASYVGLGEIRLTNNCRQQGIVDASSSRTTTLSTDSRPTAVNDKQWTLSPNPSNGVLYLSIPSNNSNPVEVVIFNELGKQVFYKNDLVASSTLLLQHLPKGFYLVQMKNQKSQLQVEKIIIH